MPTLEISMYYLVVGLNYYALDAPYAMQRHVLEQWHLYVTYAGSEAFELLIVLATFQWTRIACEAIFLELQAMLEKQLLKKLTLFHHAHDHVATLIGFLAPVGRLVVYAGVSLYRGRVGLWQITDVESWRKL